MQPNCESGPRNGLRRNTIVTSDQAHLITWGAAAGCAAPVLGADCFALQRQAWHEGNNEDPGSNRSISTTNGTPAPANNPRYPCRSSFIAARLVCFDIKGSFVILGGSIAYNLDASPSPLPAANPKQVHTFKHMQLQKWEKLLASRLTAAWPKGQRHQPQGLHLLHRQQQRPGHCWPQGWYLPQLWLPHQGCFQVEPAHQATYDGNCRNL